MNNNMLEASPRFILEKAEGQWPYILVTNGVPISYLKNKHGPCPICQEGKDRFRFDDKGKGAFFCNVCGNGYGAKFLQLYHGCSLHDAIQMVARTLSIEVEEYVSRDYLSRKKNTSLKQLREDQNYKIKRLEKIWSSSHMITCGDVVDAYLKSRNIKLERYPRVLRFNPNLPYYNDEGKFINKFPAMIAIVRDVANRPVTIHRTYLGHGCKASVFKPKKLMSPVFPGATSGAAIKLFEPVNGVIAIAEGVETALAFHIQTGLPVWATISALGMKRILLPPLITEVVIAVDNDKSNVGQNAAIALTKRLLSEGVKVTSMMPPNIGSDFADVLEKVNRV